MFNLRLEDYSIRELEELFGLVGVQYDDSTLKQSYLKVNKLVTNYVILVPTSSLIYFLSTIISNTFNGCRHAFGHFFSRRNV